MANPFLDKTNEEAKEYHRLSLLSGDIEMAIKDARMEPGLSLRDISNAIKKSIHKDEIVFLIKELSK